MMEWFLILYLYSGHVVQYGPYPSFARCMYERTIVTASDPDVRFATCRQD